MPGIIPPPGQPGYQDWRKQHPPRDILGDQFRAMMHAAAYPADVMAGRRTVNVPEATDFALNFMGAGAPASVLERQAANEMMAGSGAAMRRSASPRYTELPTGKKGYSAGFDAPPNPRVQTVRDPKRMAFPGIYANPREIADLAASRVIAENPLLQRLWGVSREDLNAMAAQRGPGMQSKAFLAAANPKGSEAALNAMTPRNAQRLTDVLGEAGQRPGLAHADAWYVMDPMYQRLEQMFGPEEAVQRYHHLNSMTSLASPSSDVLTEINRGTGAHWLDTQGRFQDFVDYGGNPIGKGGPADMAAIKGHAYHSTSHAPPMASYREAGSYTSPAPKVALYSEASGVPQTGYQWNMPVGDAHWSRAVGLADTRGGASSFDASFSGSEAQTMGPWFRDKVAAPLGIQAVPAQARLWTVMGPQTGVNSPLGQGKLELFSQQIGKAADRMGVSPETARDMILSGEAHAGLNASPIASLLGLAASNPARSNMPPRPPGTITPEQFEAFRAAGQGA